MLCYGEGIVLVQPEKRRLRGDPQQPYATLRRLSREWSWLFTVVHHGRMKNNRHKLKQKKFRLDVEFFLRAVEQDAQTACAVSVFGGFQA